MNLRELVYDLAYELAEYAKYEDPTGAANDVVEAFRDYTNGIGHDDEDTVGLVRDYMELLQQKHGGDPEFDKAFAEWDDAALKAGTQGNPESPQARKSRKKFDPTAEQQAKAALKEAGVGTGETYQQGRASSEEVLNQRRIDELLQKQNSSTERLTEAEEIELSERRARQTHRGGTVAMSVLDGDDGAVLDPAQSQKVGRTGELLSSAPDPTELEHAKDTYARENWDRVKGPKKSKMPTEKMFLAYLAEEHEIDQKAASLKGRYDKLLSKRGDAGLSFDELAKQDSELIRELSAIAKHKEKFGVSDLFAPTALQRTERRVLEAGGSKEGIKRAEAVFKDLAEGVPDSHGHREANLGAIRSKGLYTSRAEEAVPKVLMNTESMRIPNKTAESLTEAKSSLDPNEVAARERKGFMPAVKYGVAEHRFKGAVPRTFEGPADSPLTPKEMPYSEGLSGVRSPLANVARGIAPPEKRYLRAGQMPLLSSGQQVVPAVSILEQAASNSDATGAKPKRASQPKAPKTAKSILERAASSSDATGIKAFVATAYDDALTGFDTYTETVHNPSEGPFGTQTVTGPSDLIADEVAERRNPKTSKKKPLSSEFEFEGDKLFNKDYSVKKNFRDMLSIDPASGGREYKSFERPDRPISKLDRFRFMPGTMVSSTGLPTGSGYSADINPPGVTEMPRKAGRFDYDKNIPAFRFGGQKSDYKMPEMSVPRLSGQAPSNRGTGMPLSDLAKLIQRPPARPVANAAQNAAMPLTGLANAIQGTTKPQQRTVANTVQAAAKTAAETAGKVADDVPKGWRARLKGYGGPAMAALFAYPILKDMFGGGGEQQMAQSAQSEAVLNNMQQAFLAAANQGGLMPTMSQQYGNLANTALEGRLAAILQNPTVSYADVNPMSAGSLTSMGGPMPRVANPMLSALMSGQINLNPEQQGIMDPTKGFLSAFLGANAAMATPPQQMQQMPQMQEQMDQPGLSDLIRSKYRSITLGSELMNSPIQTVGNSVSDAAQAAIDQETEEIQNQLAGMTPGSEEYMKRVAALQRSGYSPRAIRTVMSGM